MNLFSRTIKSFTRRERWTSLFLLGVFVLSGGLLLRSSFGGDGAVSNKILTEGIVGEIKHLNPVFTEFSEADSDISSLVFSGLVRYNPATQAFDEDIATHTLSEDHLVYTFTLKNDVFWHDGVEVSSDDILFTFQTVIQSEEFENPILKSNFDGVKIEQKDTRTITFTLNNPNAFFFTTLNVGLLPHHLLKDVPVSELDTDEFNKLPVGTGPYKVLNPYELNDDGSTSVSLTMNPEFYGELPEIENIRFNTYPTLEDLVAHRSNWRAAARIPQGLLEEIDLDELVVNRYELPQYTALFFNTDSPILTRNKTRLAIGKAINKEEILEVVGSAKQIDTLLLNTAQEEWIHVYNQLEAQGALFDAGWTLPEGETVRSNEEGEKLSLRLVRRDFAADNNIREESLAETAEVIKEQLAAVGVEVIIESYPNEVLQEVIKNRDYDIILYGQNLGYNADAFSFWHSSQATANGLNLSNYQNPKADFYMESLRDTFDPVERENLLGELSKIISTDVPAVFLFSTSNYYLVDAKITGVNLENILHPKDRFANIAEWKLN